MLLQSLCKHRHERILRSLVFLLEFEMPDVACHIRAAGDGGLGFRVASFAAVSW